MSTNERLVRWSLWTGVILTGLFFLLQHMDVPEATYSWLVPIYLIVVVPVIVEALVDSFAAFEAAWVNFKVAWRSWRKG